MKKIVAGAVMGVAASGAVQAAEGLVNVESAHSVVATADKLESVLKDKGMTIFARIDHSAGAEKVGQNLRDTELVLFGNPQVGTKLMNCAQSVGIDLPLKALIWKDEQGKVWLSYNDPAYLAQRHSIEGCDPVLEKVSGALANFSAAATK